MRRLELRLGGHRCADTAPVAALLSEDEITAALEGLISGMMDDGIAESTARAEVAAIRARVRGDGDAQYN